GLWACSNPACDQVAREVALGIGRLFSIPASTCSCGGRVLELLYCFECGDITLGGFVADQIDEVAFLTVAPTKVPLERAVPVFKRTHAEYRWFRPGPLTTSRRWRATAPSGKQVELGFRSVEWSPLSGSLEPASGQGHGVVLSGVTDE